MDPNTNIPVIIMEFVAGGTLKDFLHADAPLSWHERLQMVEDITLGIMELHGHDPQVRKLQLYLYLHLMKLIQDTSS